MVILTQKVKIWFFWSSHLRDFKQKIIKVGIISTFSKEIMKIIKKIRLKSDTKNKAQFDSDRIFKRRLNFFEENPNWKWGEGGKNQRNPLIYWIYWIYLAFWTLAGRSTKWFYWIYGILSTFRHFAFLPGGQND